MDELLLRRRQRRRQQRRPAPRHLGEVLGYFGAMFTTVAALLGATQEWPRLGQAGRVTLLAVTVAVLTVGGWWARHPASLRRLGTVLWFGAVAAVAWLTAVVADQVEALQRNANVEYLSVALAASAVAALFWRLRPSGLQQVALFGSLVATVTALVSFAGAGNAPRTGGLWGGAVWALGLCWLLLGAGRLLQPPSTAEALGALALLFGAQAGRTSSALAPHHLWPASLWLVLGLVSAAALIAAGVMARRTNLLGIGAVGLFVFLVQAVLRWFGGHAGTPLALLAGGCGLLLVAALALRGGPPAKVPEDLFVDGDVGISEKDG
jgi:hypothetical protein